MKRKCLSVTIDIVGTFFGMKLRKTTNATFNGIYDQKLSTCNSNIHITRWLIVLSTHKAQNTLKNTFWQVQIFDLGKKKRREKTKAPWLMDRTGPRSVYNHEKSAFAKPSQTEYLMTPPPEEHNTGGI